MNDDDFEQMIGPRHCYLLKKGGSGFICGDLGDHCAQCGTVSDVLCDFPVGDGKTCDRAICEECAHEVAPDVHYCYGHFAEWEKFAAAGGVVRELGNVTPFKSRT